MSRPVGGIVGEELRKRFGGLFASNQNTLTTATTTGEIVPGDPERTSLAIVNLGTTFVVVAPSGLVGPAFGILLDPYGGALTVDMESDGMLPTLPWFYYSGNAANVLYWLQSKRDVKTNEEDIDGTLFDLDHDENT